LLKGKYDKEKMCQISLNTYSHNEPYDLQAQVIFQKKAYDDKTLPIKHTLFLESITTTKIYPPYPQCAEKSINPKYFNIEG